MTKERLIDLDTLIWPKTDVRGKQAIIPEARESIPLFLQYVPNRRGVIQAGGNVGVYPLMLAEQFERVVTFEPDAANYACLRENLRNSDVTIRSRIGPLNYALSDMSGGHLRLNVTEPDNCGAHQFMPPIGDADAVVTTETIDDLSEGFPIDLIWLDVEGAELPALKGALKTIEKYSPAIIVEEKGHGKLFGWSLDDLHAFLEGLGYELEAGYRNDRLYLRGKR